jgi:hypothetical protein
MEIADKTNDVPIGSEGKPDRGRARTTYVVMVDGVDGLWSRPVDEGGGRRKIAANNDRPPLDVKLERRTKDGGGVEFAGSTMAAASAATDIGRSIGDEHGGSHRGGWNVRGKTLGRIKRLEVWC